NMPKVTGIELVRALRSERMTLPVVLMSGTLPEEALVQNSSLQLAGTLLKPFTMRSEEHTSELQSLRHLVCRLLLEKKKKPTRYIRSNANVGFVVKSNDVSPDPTADSSRESVDDASLPPPSLPPAPSSTPCMTTYNL